MSKNTVNAVVAWENGNVLDEGELELVREHFAKMGIQILNNQ